MTEDSRSHQVSRRTLFLTSGAALALGALGAEIGNLAVGESPPTEITRTAPPDVDLMEEHGVLKRVLLVYQECLRRISIGQPAPMSAINSGATVIHDFIESFQKLWRRVTSSQRSRRPASWSTQLTPSTRNTPEGAC